MESRISRSVSIGLPLSDRVADHGLKLFRRNLSDIAQIDLMVQSLIGDIQRIALLLHILMHPLHCVGLVVVGADMQALHTQALVIGEVFHLGKVHLLFPGGFFHRPIKVRLRHKIQQADDRDPMEGFLVRIVDPRDAVLPPEALQGRDYIIEISLS